MPRVKEAPVVVQYRAERIRVDVPHTTGLWYHELTGTVLRVARKRDTGELVFPAGTYAEHETPVAKAGCLNGWAKATAVVDV